jgi:hypothetical protein
MGRVYDNKVIAWGLDGHDVWCFFYSPFSSAQSRYSPLNCGGSSAADLARCETSGSWPLAGTRCEAGAENRKLTGGTSCNLHLTQGGHPALVGMSQHGLHGPNLPTPSTIRTRAPPPPRRICTFCSTWPGWMILNQTNFSVDLTHQRYKLPTAMKWFRSHCVQEHGLTKLR